MATYISDDYSNVLLFGGVGEDIGDFCLRLNLDTMTSNLYNIKVRSIRNQKINKVSGFNSWLLMPSTEGK